MLKKTRLFTLIIAVFLIGSSIALAQSPLGIGVSEQAAPATGLLAKLVIWQKELSKILNAALIATENNPSASFWLIGISFLYGILHAAGPGHGKAVISSYIVANDETLKRGILLAFFSSLLQAFSAIIIVFIIFQFGHIFGLTTASSVDWVTTASYFLVMIFGLYLLIKTTPRLFSKKLPSKKASSNNEAMNLFDDNALANTLSTPQKTSVLGQSNQAQPALKYQRGEHNFIGTNATCEICGDTHIIDAEKLQKPLKWKDALSIVFSVGLRPCGGALLILSFAFLYHMIWGGLASVFAMSFGTFITVSTLAAIAVYMKGFAFKLASRHTSGQKVQFLIQWCAAFFIFIMGATLSLLPFITT